MARQLAAEKAKSAALTKKLKKSKREKKELVASMTKELTSDGPASSGTTFEFDSENEFTSTRNLPVTARVDSRYAAATSQEESRFFSSMNQLSVASINVPECKPTDDGDIHRQTYELWIDLLMDSMRLAGIEDEHTMFTVFKVKAGVKLLEIFRNTKSQQDDPDVETRPFSNAMQRLKSYFGSGSDIMLMRRKLALMAQKADETDLAYITRVGSIARLCGYDEGKEFEEIAATIAEHARQKDVRTTALKILSKKGSFTDLVDKVREIESIRLNEEYVMRKRGRPDSASVAAVSAPFNRTPRFQNRFQSYQAPGTANGPTRRQQRPMDRNQSRNNPYQRAEQKSQQGWRQPRSGQYGNKAGQSTEKCWRCESVFHTPDECYSRGKVCNFCGQLGHIRRACPDRFTQVDAHLTGQRSTNIQEESPNRVAAVEKIKDTPVDEENVSGMIDN